VPIPARAAGIVPSLGSARSIVRRPVISPVSSMSAVALALVPLAGEALGLAVVVATMAGIFAALVETTILTRP
jgi:hypothetical protein